MSAMDLYYMGIEYLELSNEIGSHFKTYERLFQCYMRISDTDKAFEYAGICAKTGNYKLAEKLLTEILARNPEYKKAEKLLDTIDLF